MHLERYHENPEVFHVNTLPDRAYYIPYESEEAALAQRREDSGRLHLRNGRWDFRYYARFADVPQDIADPGLNWIDADGIDVPCSWQAQGYGVFQYVNIDAIIPHDYPRVPEDNPCGAYHTCFEYRRNPDAPRAELTFEGVDSCFYAWLNGRFVGYSQVSHATSIFDVTELLAEGENHLVVLNLKFCDGTYFENQDKFRLTGIFRDVYLLDRPETHVRDFFAHTKLKADFAAAKLRVDAEIENPRPGAKLSAKLFAPDGSCAGEACADASAEAAELNFDIEHPLLWNAEQPKLYMLLLCLDGEFIPQQIGLRSVSVEGGVLCVNGRPVKLKGVNMHESDPRTGNATGSFQWDEGLKLMKRHNVNAIRTSHYPCPPVMMEYCNRYGFYVISEADLETHGAGQAEGVKGYNRDGYCRGFHELASAMMDNPACREAVLDRVRKNPIRDKNQCAVIIWSLGNESGWGENLERAGRWVKEYDPSRLVHYENLYHNPARTPDFSMLDVTSRMYPSLEWLRNHFEGAAFDLREEFIACMGEFTERYLAETAGTKPLILCEFTHAMGNSSGDVGDYFELIYKHPAFAGGFVWEWRDHAQYAGDDRSGRPKFLYGGDMGEFPNDGNFCVDGLTAPDGTPHSSLTEFKNVTRPACAELTPEGRIRIRSRLDFADLRDAVTCEWEMARNGEVCERGALALPSVPPREAAELPLPCAAAGEGWRHLRLIYRARFASPAVPEGWELGFDQLDLTEAAPDAEALLPKVEARRPLKLLRGERRLRVCGEGERGKFAYTYDARTGAFSSLVLGGRELLSRPMEYNLYRAPTDNDLRGLELDALWRDLGYDRPVVRASEPSVEERDGGVEIATNLRFAAVGRRCFLEGDVRWRVEPDGRIRLAADMRRPGHLVCLPRFGLRLFLREELGRGVEYLGYGPGECYVDKHRAAWFGRFEADADSLFVNYIRPQENGSHWGCRLLGVGDGPRLRVAAGEGGSFSFNASRYSQEELMSRAHDFELMPGRDTVLCLDYMQTGIGSGSCGPALQDKYRLDAEAFRFALTLLPD